LFHLNAREAGTVGHALFDNQLGHDGQDSSLGIPAKALQTDPVDVCCFLPKKVGRKIKRVGIKAKQHETAPSSHASGNGGDGPTQ
jgi:hypothetical protein